MILYGAQLDTYGHWPPLECAQRGVPDFWRFGNGGSCVRHRGEYLLCGSVLRFKLNAVLAVQWLSYRCSPYSPSQCSLPTADSRGGTPNAALGAICAALYCFVRGTETSLNWKWIAPGAVAAAVGVLFSWEAAPLGFVLLALGNLATVRKGTANCGSRLRRRRFLRVRDSAGASGILFARTQK